MRAHIGIAAAVLLLAACDPSGADLSNLPASPTTSVVLLGRRIANESCAPCHGALLRGDTSYGIAAPSLAIVRQYTWDQFNALFDSGLTREGHVAEGPMGTTVRPALMADERQALYLFLTSFGLP